MKCLCAALRRTTREITRFYEQNLQAAGLTPSQFELLSLLSARPSLTQSGFAAALHLDQTTFSRNVRVLINRHWITRRSSPQDQRRATYALSAEGKETLRAALPHWKKAHEQMRQGLGKDWDSVWRSLDRLSEATFRA